MSFHQLLTTYYSDNSVSVSIIEFHQVKDIKLIVILTYYCDLFESFPLERVSFHKFLTYYWDIGVAVIIKEFRQVKDIILVIITYYYNFFDSFPLGRMSFHQLLTTYYRYLGIAVSI